MNSRLGRGSLVLLSLTLHLVPTVQAQTCPTAPPGNPTTAKVTFSGPSCTTTCVVNSTVMLTVPDNYAFQSCDSVQWTFGDGTSATVAGSRSTTHVFTRTALFQPYARVFNTLGSAYFYGSVPVTTAPGCPTTYPPSAAINWIAPTCSSQSSSQPCAIGQPVTFMVSTYSGTTPESCNRVTINFGDGTSASLPQGTFTATHSYATAGRYNLSGNVSNDFGSYALGTPILTAGNGTVGFANSYVADVSEGSVAHFQVTRSTVFGSVSVNYATSDATARAGQHYVAASGTLTFANGEMTKTIDVPLIDDTRYNARLAFLLTLSNPTDGYLVSNAQLTVGITDNDISVLSFSDSSYTVNENGGPFSIAVKRTGDPTTIVSARYSFYCCIASRTTHSGVANISGYVIFGANETSKTILVPLIDDNLYQGFRRVTAQLDSIVGGAFPTCCQATVSLNILDDEPKPVLTLQRVSVPEGNSGTSTASVAATLSGPMADELTFNMYTSDGTAKAPVDYARVFSSEVRIGAGTTSTTLPFTIVGNTKLEPDKAFVVNASNVQIPPCCAPIPSGWSSDSAQPGFVTILNDDPGITPSALALSSASEGALVLNLGLGPDVAQTITLSSSAPSVATVPSMLIAAAGQRTQIIPVKPVNPGGTEISASLPGGGTFTARVSVYDLATLSFSPSPPVQVPVGGTARIGVSVLPPLSTPLTLRWSVADPTVVSAPSSLVIAPGQKGTLTLTGLKLGSTVLATNTGPEHGTVPFYLPIDVVEALTMLNIAAVSPESGPTEGGTLVTVTGANIRGGCTLFFGNAAAAQFTVINDSAAAAIAPPHGPGPVAVTLNCGTETSTLDDGFTYIGRGRGRSVHH